MEKDNNIKHINNEKNALDKKKEISSFNDILAGINIDEKTEKAIKKDIIIEKGRDIAVSLFGTAGKIIDSALSLDKELQSKINDKKKEYLLFRCIQKINSHELFLNRISEVIKNPSGFFLLNKIFIITEKSFHNEEVFDYISNLALNIFMSDFEKLFDKHIFVLSQIEKMSIQSIRILLDNEHWPLFRLGKYELDNEKKAKSEWISVFRDEYSRSKRKIDDKPFIARLNQTLLELHQMGLIDARLENRDGSSFKCMPTLLGEELLSYLKLDNEKVINFHNKYRKSEE